MDATEALKFVLVVVGFVVAAPVLAAIIRLTVFLTSLKNAVESGFSTQKRHGAQLADHETRISLLERPHLDRRAGDIP